jgi:hypothetical protein
LDLDLIMSHGRLRPTESRYNGLQL